MPNEKANNKKEKLLCVDNLRHAEYYEMQGVFDDLYARSKCGEEFTNLMSLILSRENILLAYRNIKTNAGSKTAGTDGLTISDIDRLVGGPAAVGRSPHPHRQNPGFARKRCTIQLFAGKRHPVYAAAS